jgi:hypothetical protein
MGGFRRNRDGSLGRIEMPRHSVGICHSDGRYSRGKITSRRTHLMSDRFGATPAEMTQYGNLNLWQSLMLLQRWSPLIGYGQRFVNEADPYRKSLIVSEAAEWLASQTKAQADDQLVRLLADMLKTPQGEAIVRWILLQVEAVR